MRTLRVDDLNRLRTASDPRISPDGSRIAFVVTEPDTDRDRLASHIWVVPRDGHGPVQWTRGDQRDAAPRWSPDGRLLAFLSSRGEAEKPQVYLLPADGGEARRLTAIEGGVLDLAWSPSGDRLAVVAALAPDTEATPATPIAVRRLLYKSDGTGFLAGRQSHLFVVPVEGGEPRRLTHGDYSVATPAWSPDGRAIAFAAAMHEDRDLDLAVHLFCVDGEGGDLRQVVSGTWMVAAPLWTGDGQELIFGGRRRATDLQTSLFRVAAAGGEPRPLLPGFDRTVMLGAPGYPGGRPAITGDGAAVLFCARIGGCTHVYRQELGGDAAPRPVLDGADHVVQGLSVASRSDVGAAVVGTTDFPADVFLLNVGGFEATRLTGLNRELLAEADLARAGAAAVPGPGRGGERGLSLGSRAGRREAAARQYPWRAAQRLDPCPLVLRAAPPGAGRRGLVRAGAQPPGQRRLRRTVHARRGRRLGHWR